MENSVGYSSAQEGVQLCNEAEKLTVVFFLKGRKQSLFLFFSLSMFIVPLLSNQSHLEVSVVTLQNVLSIFMTDYLV